MRAPFYSLTLIAVFVLSPPVAADAGCPANTLSAFDSSVTTSDPSRELSLLFPAGNGYAGAGYNLIEGSGYALSSKSDCRCSPVGSASTHDVFQLAGPASLTPVTFIARLEISAHWTTHENPYATTSAQLREGDSNSQSYVGNRDEPPTTTLSIPISRRVGESFDLFISFTASTAGLVAYGAESATISGRLSFAGLPGEYAVVSCQGYVSDPAVPARATSWGRLKAIYR
jgi:hypothetical protein